MKMLRSVATWLGHVRTWLGKWLRHWDNSGDSSWTTALLGSYGLIAVTLAVAQRSSQLKQSLLLGIYVLLFASLFFANKHFKGNLMCASALSILFTLLALVLVYAPTSPEAQYFLVDATAESSPVFDQLIPAVQGVVVRSRASEAKVGLGTYGDPVTDTRQDCAHRRKLVSPPARVPHVAERVDRQLRDVKPGGSGSLARGLELAAEELKSSRGSKKVSAIFVRPNPCDADVGRMNEVLDNWPQGIEVIFYSVGVLSSNECNQIDGWVNRLKRHNVAASRLNDPNIAAMPDRLQPFGSYGVSYFSEQASGPNSSCP